MFQLTLTSSGWVENTLYSYGPGPVAGLVFDTAGNLYGEGPHGDFVFELTPDANGQWTPKVLYNGVGCGNGEDLDGGLILDAAGTLYGTAAWGGKYHPKGGGCIGIVGVVFTLSPGANGQWTYARRYSFNGKDGSGPVGTDL